jgi:hypothetical protein
MNKIRRHPTQLIQLQLWFCGLCALLPMAAQAQWDHPRLPSHYQWADPNGTRPPPSNTPQIGTIGQPKEKTFGDLVFDRIVDSIFPTPLTAEEKRQRRKELERQAPSKQTSSNADTKPQREEEPIVVSNRARCMVARYLPPATSSDSADASVKADSLPKPANTSDCPPNYGGAAR